MCSEQISKLSRIFRSSVEQDVSSRNSEPDWTEKTSVRLFAYPLEPGAGNALIMIKSARIRCRRLIGLRADARFGGLFDVVVGPRRRDGMRRATTCKLNLNGADSEVS